MILGPYYAHGHKNVLAMHKSTLEITKEDFLTKKGDCIIGINSNICAYDLPQILKKHLLEENKAKLILRVNDIEDEIIFQGSKNLTFLNRASFVIRKSNFIDDRTIGIKANKSAKDINRELIFYLKQGKILKFWFELL